MRRVVPITLLGILLGGHGVTGQEGPEVTFVEVFRIGGLDAPEHSAFPAEPALVVDTSGFIFAASRGDSFITVFNNQGNFVRNLGRAGRGPGEFTRVAGHGLLGDTVWARNWPEPRISMFLRDGTHLSSKRTAVDYGHVFTAPQGVTAYLLEGRAVAIPDAVPVGASERVRLPVLLGDRELALVDTLTGVLLPQGMVLSGVGSFTLAPYPTPPLVSVSSDGSTLLVADWDDHGRGPLQLTKYHPSGAREWRREVSFDRGRLPDRVRDSLIAVGMEVAQPQMERARRAGSVRKSLRQLVEEGLSIPAYEPPIYAVVIGVDGSIWLQRDPTEVDNQWTVLTKTGEQLFNVRIPTGHTLRQATSRSIWATASDGFGIPYIIRMDLVVS